MLVRCGRQNWDEHVPPGRITIRFGGGFIEELPS